MRPYPVAIVIIALLLTPVIPAPDAGGTQPCGPGPADHYVGDPAQGDHTSIQDAIDAADEGDTIHIRAGVYFERIVLNKTVSIQGEGWNKTILNASWEGDGILVTADNCSISCLSVEAAGFAACMMVYGNRTTITDCAVSGAVTGIYLAESEYNNITGCSMVFCGHGLHIANSGYNNITDCWFSYNYGDGVNLFLGYSNTFKDCESQDNQGSGYYLYWLSTDNVLSNCRGSENEHGVYVFDSDRTAIIDSIFEGNNGSGIHLESHDNQVRGSISRMNGEYGFYCYHAANNTVENCRSGNNGADGVYIKYSEDNVFSGNIVLFNEGYAVKMGPQSLRNLVYDNDLMCNNDWKIQASDIGDGNRWDDGSQGNFWSDMTYRNPNATSDGDVWDTPYLVAGSAGCSDGYPLSHNVTGKEYDCGEAPTTPPNGTYDGDEDGDGGEGPGHDPGGEDGGGDDDDPYDAADGTMVMSLVLLAVLVIFVAYIYGYSRRRG